MFNKRHGCTGLSPQQCETEMDGSQEAAGPAASLGEKKFLVGEDSTLAGTKQRGDKDT